MFWAILITFASVLLGTVLALSPKVRDSWMGPLRTFALTAALSVVVIHLLPSALITVGVWGIVVFFVGLVAPELLGKLGETLWRARHSAPTGPQNAERRRLMALEASYFGLLLHRVGDGLGLGAFTGEMYAAAGSAGVIVALSAHAVPVVAIMVLSFDSVQGRGSALLRALGLVVASTVGVWFSHSIPHDSFATASAYISAFVGGTLLHVVTHDLSMDLPKTVPQRLLDLVAVALGIFVSLIGSESHGHAGEADHATDRIGHVLLGLSVETGPYLLLGLVIGALLTAWGPKIPDRFFVSRGAVRDAARGTIVGAPLPLCSCTVLPVSSALLGRGAGPAMVVSFMLATPALGIETFALSVRFLGWEFALVRVLGALLLAFLTGILIARLVKSSAVNEEHPLPLQLPAGQGSFPRRALHAFDELLHHVGAWMLLGLLAAALLEVAIPPFAIEQVRGWFAQFLAITVVAVPSYICAPSAVPLAAVLISKGISPGAVLVGVLLGPATNIATVVFLRRWFGNRTTALGLLGLVALAWALGGAVAGFLQPGAINVAVAETGHVESKVWLACAVLSGLVMVRALYRAGARGFLSTLVGEHGHSHGEPPSPLILAGQPAAFSLASSVGSLGHEHCDHDHAHDHDHDHGHGHGPHR